MKRYLAFVLVIGGIAFFGFTTHAAVNATLWTNYTLPSVCRTQNGTTYPCSAATPAHAGGASASYNSIYFYVANGNVIKGFKYQLGDIVGNLKFANAITWTMDACVNSSGTGCVTMTSGYYDCSATYDYIKKDENDCAFGVHSITTNMPTGKTIYRIVLQTYGDDSKYLTYNTAIATGSNLIDIYTTGYGFTITQPTMMKLISSPYLVYGNCMDTVHYEYYTHASSTIPHVFGESTCTAGSWSFSMAIPILGVGTINASSTAGIFGDQEHTVDFILTQSDPNNPYLPDEYLSNYLTNTTTATSTFGFLDTMLYNLSQARPWAYIPQIVGSFSNAMSNPTSTPWLADIALPATSIGLSTSTSASIPGITQATLDAIPQSFKNITRPLSTLVIYAGFVFYIWSLRNRFI
jgi:hypothetical protein